MCFNHSSCKYWTWIEDYNGYPQYCHLKDANSGLSYVEGVISGEKNCMAPKGKDAAQTYLQTPLQLPELFPKNTAD